MKLSEIQCIIGAQVLVGTEWLDREVTTACGADLMSDVLAYSRGRALLLTGLINAQVIRTAEMIDLTAVVFVRGKLPSEDVAQMAMDRGIPLMSTPYPLYEACGLLYSHGLAGNHPISRDRRRP